MVSGHRESPVICQIILLTLKFIMFLLSIWHRPQELLRHAIWNTIVLANKFDVKRPNNPVSYGGLVNVCATLIPLYLSSQVDFDRMGSFGFSLWYTILHPILQDLKQPGVNSAASVDSVFIVIIFYPVVSATTITPSARTMLLRADRPKEE